jgi:hypothetical protein
VSADTAAVRVSVVIDSVDPHAVADFWRQALGYRAAADLGQFVVLAPERGEAGPVLILQRVPEERAAKNRVHLDLHPRTPTSTWPGSRASAPAGSATR